MYKFAVACIVFSLYVYILTFRHSEYDTKNISILEL